MRFLPFGARRQWVDGLVRRRPCLVFILALVPLLAGAQESPYDDEFSSRSLDGKWQRVRLADDRWRMDDKGMFVLKTARGDIARWSNVAPLLVQKAPPGDWEIETSVCAAPRENFQQAGLVIVGRGTDHVRITMLHAAGNIVIECLRDASQGRLNRQLRPPASPCYQLRITREGRTYRGYYRLAGQLWQLVGEFPGTDLADPSFGLTGFNGAADSQRPMEASFDYFHVR